MSADVWQTGGVLSTRIAELGLLRRGMGSQFCVSIAQQVIKCLLRDSNLPVVF